MLKERAAGAAAEWLRLIGGLVKEGVRSGELDPGTDPRAAASVVVSTLEGALMLTKLQDDPVHMNRAIEHLESHLKAMASEGGRKGT